MRLLVVEDEEELASALVEALTDRSFHVDLARDGTTAVELVEQHTYDLIILDWKIPPPTGIELLRDWRAQGIESPVLMLTGQSSVRDRVSGLDVGADDYLTKPFAFAELDARVRSLLRRGDRALTDLSAADLTMDRAGYAVTVDGRSVAMTPKEFDVLEYLLARKDRVVRRSELYERVWTDETMPSSNVMDVLMHRVRRKVDGDRADRLIHTVVGVGYILKSHRC